MSNSKKICSLPFDETIDFSKTFGARVYWVMLVNTQTSQVTSRQLRQVKIVRRWWNGNEEVYSSDFFIFDRDQFIALKDDPSGLLWNEKMDAILEKEFDWENMPILVSGENQEDDQ